MNNDNIGVYNIENLFLENITIPVYQRPYLWDISQVKNLLEDFLEIYENNYENNNKQIYLIGNMIFHKDIENNKLDLNIVDGQQRTITLALLLYNLKHDQAEKFLAEIQISNPLSKKAIYDNNHIIRNFISRNLSDQDKQNKFLAFLKEKVLITYIIAKTEDEAFIFFDSQNTRGKSLERHHLLKAHHLRDKNIDAKKRVIYAKVWEDYDENKLKDLLEVYLALTRNFVKGNYKFDVDVYEEFKSNAFTSNLNNYNQPPIFQNVNFNFNNDKLRLILKDDIEIKIGNGLIIDNAKEYLPFEILQSIGGGEEFFWYIYKYLGLKDKFDDLLDKDIVNTIDSLSPYLRDYFYAMSFLYFDKFGNDKFNEFSYLILWLVSYYRLKKYSVRYLGVRNFIRDYNVFTKLFFSYSSNEIINKIKHMIKYELSEIEQTEVSKGIRNTYFGIVKNKKELTDIARLVKDSNE